MNRLAFSALSALALIAVLTTAASAQTVVPRFTQPDPFTFRSLASPVTFEIQIDTYGGPAFDLDLSQACTPPAECYATGENVRIGQGHAHIYVEDQANKGAALVFRALDDGASNDGRLSVTANLPRGRYCAWVDVTENDHRTILKQDGPRAIPPVSSVCFSVLSSLTPLTPPTPPTPPSQPSPPSFYELPRIEQRQMLFGQ